MTDPSQAFETWCEMRRDSSRLRSAFWAAWQAGAAWAMHSREQEIFALMVERDHWKELAEDAINGPPAVVTGRSPLDPEALNLLRMKAAEIERDELRLNWNY